MSEADEAPPRPRHGATVKAAKAARAARLAEAMRDNLRKRRRQQQARHADDKKPHDVKPS